jgi:hypothetical protein
MSRFDEVLRARLAENGLALPDDEQARKDYPTLWEFLTRTEVEGQRLKEPAKVTVAVGLGCWTVGLSDGSLGMGLTATSRTLLDAFEALEQALRDPKAAWSVWKGRSVDLRDRKRPKGEK